MAFDFGQQVADADARHEDHDVDLAGDDVVGKIDGLAIFLDGHFAHRGADQGHAAEALDEAGHFAGAATLERRHAQTGKALGGVGHEVGRMRERLRNRPGGSGAVYFSRARADCPDGSFHVAAKKTKPAARSAEDRAAGLAKNRAHLARRTARGRPDRLAAPAATGTPADHLGLLGCGGGLHGHAGLRLGAAADGAALPEQQVPRPEPRKRPWRRPCHSYHNCCSHRGADVRPTIRSRWQPAPLRPGRRGSIQTYASSKYPP